MRHIFQDKCWEKHPRAAVHRLLWIKEFGKGNDKEFGNKRGIFWNFIYEDNGN